MAPVEQRRLQMPAIFLLLACVAVPVLPLMQPRQERGVDSRGVGVHASVAGARRIMPRGSIFDVSVPANVPAGLLLDNDLTVVGFRSPREAAELRDALERLRAPASNPITAATTAVSQQTYESHQTVQDSPPVAHSLFDRYSMAEYSGLITVGDILVGVDKQAVWSWSYSSVAEALAMSTHPAERVLTFVRPIASHDLRSASASAGTGAAAINDAYASYVQRLAAKTVPLRRSPGSTSAPALGGVQMLDTPSHYNVIISCDEPIGAMLSSTLVVISTDPFDTERYVSSMLHSSRNHTSGSHWGRNSQSMALVGLPRSVITSILLRRGQLSGRAWPGDQLVAVDGQPLRNHEDKHDLSPAVLFEALRIPVPQEPSLPASSASNDPDDHNGRVIALHARLGRQQHQLNDSALKARTVTIAADGTEVDGNGAGDGDADFILCLAEGRHCLPSHDIDIGALADIIGGPADTPRDVGGAAHRRVTLTFKRASHLPRELLGSSRHAAVAKALTRLAGDAERTSRGGAVDSSTDPTASTISHTNQEPGGMNGALLSCRGSRCAFKAQDRVYMRTHAVVAHVAMDRDDGSSGMHKALPHSSFSSSTNAASKPSLSTSSFEAQSQPAAPLAVDLSSGVNLTATAIPALFGGSFPCSAAGRPILVAEPGEACTRSIKCGAGKRRKSAKGNDDPKSGGGTSRKKPGKREARDERQPTPEDAASEPPAATASACRGAIIIVDRGTCTFPLKASMVQAAGGIAVIVVNDNAGPPIAMPGSTSTIAKAASTSGTVDHHAVVRPPSSSGMASTVDDASIAIAAAMVDIDTGRRIKAAVYEAASRGATLVGSMASHLRPDADVCRAAGAARRSDATAAAAAVGLTATLADAAPAHSMTPLDHKSLADAIATYLKSSTIPSSPSEYALGFDDDAESRAPPDSSSSSSNSDLEFIDLAELERAFQAAAG